MEGKAPNALLDHQATDAKTKTSSPISARTTSGSCAMTCSSSSSTARARSPSATARPAARASSWNSAPSMGDHFEEPVLLDQSRLGRALAVQAVPLALRRVPRRRRCSRRNSSRPRIASSRTTRRTRRTTRCRRWRTSRRTTAPRTATMMAEVKDVMDNAGTLFPALKGKTLELAGLRVVPGLERSVRRGRTSTNRT